MKDKQTDSTEDRRHNFCVATPRKSFHCCAVNLLAANLAAKRCCMIKNNASMQQECNEDAARVQQQ